MNHALAPKVYSIYLTGSLEIGIPGLAWWSNNIIKEKVSFCLSFSSFLVGLLASFLVGLLGFTEWLPLC